MFNLESRVIITQTNLEDSVGGTQFPLHDAEDTISVLECLGEMDQSDNPSSETVDFLKKTIKWARKNIGLGVNPILSTNDFSEARRFVDYSLDLMGLFETTANLAYKRGFDTGMAVAEIQHLPPVDEKLIQQPMKKFLISYPRIPNPKYLR